VDYTPETTKGPEAFAAEPSSHRGSLRVSLAGAYGREPDVASPSLGCSEPFDPKPSTKPVTALPESPGVQALASPLPGRPASFPGAWSPSPGPTVSISGRAASTDGSGGLPGLETSGRDP
jgi:hypothetical protein